MTRKKQEGCMILLNFYGNGRGRRKMTEEKVGPKIGEAS